MYLIYLICIKVNVFVKENYQLVVFFFNFQEDSEIEFIEIYIIKNVRNREVKILGVGGKMGIERMVVCKNIFLVRVELVFLNYNMQN